MQDQRPAISVELALAVSVCPSAGAVAAFDGYRHESEATGELKGLLPLLELNGSSFTVIAVLNRNTCGEGGHRRTRMPVTC